MPVSTFPASALCWYFAEEAAGVLGVQVHGVLRQMWEQGRLTRQSVSGKYLYTAPDHARQQAQRIAPRPVEELQTVAGSNRILLHSAGPEVPEDDRRASKNEKVARALFDVGFGGIREAAGI